MAFPDLAYL